MKLPIPIQQSWICPFPAREGQGWVNEKSNDTSYSCQVRIAVRISDLSTHANVVGSCSRGQASLFRVTS
ncbi:MAG: hypothetical protein K8R40_02070 [Anaerolineaceae bacterium]|nr:hypothetical protein [Anaerolineaceae bacterium]